eukprot:g3915.t1
MTHNRGSRPSDMVISKAKKYINGFINSQGGGSIHFGVDERESGFFIEAVEWGIQERRRARNCISNVCHSIYPSISSDLCRAIFVPVVMPEELMERDSENVPNEAVDDLFVFEIHIRHGTQSPLYCVRPPLCFVELCEAYERSSDCTNKLSMEQIVTRLQALAVPRPLDFRVKIHQKGLVKRTEIDSEVFPMIAEAAKQRARDALAAKKGLPPSSASRLAVLIVGEPGSGKSSWISYHIMKTPWWRRNIAPRVSASARQREDRLICSTCQRRFASRTKLHAHLDEDGLCTRADGIDDESKGNALAASTMASPAASQFTILAHHFCMRENKSTLSPGRFVQSVAAQIASNNEFRCARSVMYGTEVERALQEHRAMQCPDDALEIGILAPLRSIPNASVRKTFAIVIDALDEAVVSGEQGSESSRTIVELISRAIPKFPSWLVVLATSRPDPHVMRWCGFHFKVARIGRLAPPTKIKDVDLRMLCMQHLAMNPERKHLTDAICSAADGNFLYASMLIDGIRSGRYSADLSSLGALQKDGMDTSAQLLRVFSLEFERNFPNPERDFCSRERPVRQLLEAVMASALSSCQLTVARLRNIVVNSDAAILAARSVLRISPTTGTVGIYHLSLMEWLCGESSMQYRCQVERGHALLACFFVRTTLSDASRMEVHLRRYLQMFSVEDYLPPRAVTKEEDDSLAGSSLEDGLPWNVPCKAIYFSALHMCEAGDQHSGLLSSIPENILNATDSRGRTAVFLACQEGGSRSALMLLLQAGARPLCRVAPRQVTPLHITCRRNDAAMVEALIRHSKDIVDVEDVRGRTALHIAGGKGFVQVVRTLFKAGADPLRLTRDGRTPLFYAAERNHVRCAEYLLDAMQSSIQTSDAMQAMSEVKLQIKNILYEQRWWEDDKHLDAMKALQADRRRLSAKIARTFDCETSASANSPRQQFSDFVDMAAAKSGKTALYVACERGNKAVVRLLLARGACADSPCHIASLNGEEATIMTPAAIAGAKKKFDIVRILERHANDAWGGSLARLFDEEGAQQ